MSMAAASDEPLDERGRHVPDLDSIGIDEAEPGVCEDTYENRSVLRKAGWFWESVPDGDGGYTGNIRVFDPEATKERRLSVWHRKKSILTDQENPWSEYLDPLDLPSDADVPLWVRNRIRGHVTGLSEGKSHGELKPLPVRCQQVRTDGTRCWNWVSRTDGILYCSSHLPSTVTQETARIRAAKLKLLQAAPAAADNLEYLMENAAGEAVRLKASTEILDRAGVRGGVEISADIQLEVTDPAQAVRARLSALAENAKAAREMMERRLAEEAAEAEKDVVDVEEVPVPAPVVEQPGLRVSVPGAGVTVESEGVLSSLSPQSAESAPVAQSEESGP